MYKVRGKVYQRHVDASNAAQTASRIVPAHLKAPTGGAWYWRGRYCGRRFLDLFR